MRFMLMIMVLSITLAGCFPKSRSEYLPQIYKAPDVEAQWIRGGEPLMYKDQEWIPADDTENLTDTEVYKLGEYRDVLFFAAKQDVEPYQRLYTKFGRNRYRYFVLKSP